MIGVVNIKRAICIFTFLPVCYIIRNIVTKGSFQLNEIEFNLMLKSIKKSERALETIYNFYYPRIIFHLRKKYGKPFAEDVAQEFFYDLLEKEAFKHVYHPTTWVYLICDNLAKRKVQSESKYVFLRSVIQDDEDEEMFKEERYGDLYQVIKELNDVEREIVEMYYWEGYKLREIAAALNLSYPLIRQKHKRIIKKIKNNFPDVTFSDF